MGGFTATFTIVGLVQLMATTAMCIGFPDLPSMDSLYVSSTEMRRGFQTVLKIPSMYIFLFGTFATQLATDFVLAILQPYVKQQVNEIFAIWISKCEIVLVTVTCRRWAQRPTALIYY